jgi:hypothetical protein
MRELYQIQSLRTLVEEFFGQQLLRGLLRTIPGHKLGRVAGH